MVRCPACVQLCPPRPHQSSCHVLESTNQIHSLSCIHYRDVHHRILPTYCWRIFKQFITLLYVRVETCLDTALPFSTSDLFTLQNLIYLQNKTIKQALSGLTKVDGLHGNAGRVLAISFLIELHHLHTIVILWGVEGIQLASVCAQLLNSPCTECVASSNEHAEAILN